jgi:hypothetical protein
MIHRPRWRALTVAGCAIVLMSQNVGPNFAGESGDTRHALYRIDQWGPFHDLVGVFQGGRKTMTELDTLTRIGK